MAKEKQPSFSQSSNDEDQISTVHVDIKAQLATALVDLNIARKASLLYPVEHLQVKHSTQQANNYLEALFKKAPEIKLGVTAKALIFGGETLDPENYSYRDLALALNHHGIAVWTLKKGLTAKELAKFFKLLSLPSHQLQDQGGLINCLTQNEIDHIQIILFDYANFKVTEQSEIQIDPAHSTSKSHQDPWHDMAIQLMQDPSESHAPSISQVNLQKMAKLINENPDKTKTILQRYEDTINNYLTSDGYNHSMAQNKNPLDGINTLLQELNPQLREQFLNSTLTQCARVAEAPQTVELISLLSQNLIAEMLQQANLMEGPISESLIQLIQRISPIMDANHQGPSLMDTLELAGSEKNQYQELFKQGDYQKFVDQDYDHILHHIRGNSTREINPESTLENTADLEPSHLDRHIFRALIGLLDQCNAPDEYSQYATKAIEIAKENSKQDDFSLVFEAMTTFHRHDKSEKPEEIAHAARQAIAKLTDRKILDSFLCSLESSNAEVPPDIGPLIETIGPKIVTPLVKKFILGKQGEKQHAILSILTYYKKESIKTAHNFVKRHDIGQIKRLILLIRKLEDRASSAYLRTLVAHSDPVVNQEALAALLYFKDPWGIVFLRDQLNADEIEKRERAIAMAGDYRIVEMVPHLTSCLKFRALSKSDIKCNRNLVTAMGKIGDAAAIPFLTKLVKNTWSFYRSNLKQLRVEVFKSLHNYPKSEIESLMEIGRKTKDTTIQQICKQLSQ